MSMNEFTRDIRSAPADPAAASPRMLPSELASAPTLEAAGAAALAAADPEPARPAVRAELARRITFASHQCDVPVIVSLAVSNPTGEDLEDLELHLAAEPEVLGARTWTIDRIRAGDELRIADRRVTIAGGLLAALNERMRAEIRLVLRTAGGRVLAEGRHEIIALARNEWGGSRHMPELLGAFVMPNDPAVEMLLREASDILARSGRRSALEGYQAKSRERSWELVSAVWSAVSAKGLTYANPPASFDTEGQKVRTPSAIEERKLGTCLDLALYFAAAIEQVGLHPVVVFTRGHAFAGAWLEPKALPSLTVDDASEIRKAIDMKELVVFETTLATADSPVPFGRAVDEGRRQLDLTMEESFNYAIDIRQARARGILPLPDSASAEGGSGAAEPRARVVTLEAAPVLPPFSAELDQDEAERTPEQRLDRWKRSLLDLSLRNRLLNLRNTSVAIPIFCPSPADLEDLLAKGRKISLICPPVRTASGQMDPNLRLLRTGEDTDRLFAEQALERGEIVANMDVAKLDKAAIELYRKAKADFEEGGANTLFLTLGMLAWRPKGRESGLYRAPLVMLPVKLERASARSRPQLRLHEDEPIFNPTLVQMLRQDFEIDLGGLAQDLPQDEHGVDVARTWEIVRQKVRNAPGFEVLEEVALSTFSFAKYLMWKDLQDRSEQLKAAPFVRHTIDHPREPYEGGASFLDPRTIDRAIDPATLIMPLNADSSQIVAIHASGGRGDFVLEGPPGTGKSETIGNIIAHNIALGRRVLFVSEKMAALDVVYERLKKCGLGDFCLELHSAKANKKAVIDQLGAAWTSRKTFTAVEWEAKAAELARARASLNTYVAALHAPGPAGISARQAIGRVLAWGDSHRLELGWATDPTGQGRAPTPAALRDLEELAARLDRAFAAIDPGDVAAFRDVGQTEWSFDWSRQLVGEAKTFAAAAAELGQAAASFAARLGLAVPARTVAEAAALADVARLLPDAHRQDLRFALDADGREALRTLAELGPALAEYRRARERVAAAYPDDRLAAAPIATWAAARDQAARRMWPFGSLARRRLRREIRETLGLGKTEVASPERDLEALGAVATIRTRLDELAGRLPAKTPWRGLATERDLEVSVSAGRLLREAVARVAAFQDDPLGARASLVRVLGEGRDMLEPGASIAEAARALVAAHDGFAAALDRYRAACVGTGDRTSRVDRDVAALGAGAEAIVAREKRLNGWCAWIEARRDARAAGLEALVHGLEEGDVAAGRAVETFRTAYARWLAPILVDARPELARFRANDHAALIERFRALDEEITRTTADYVRAKLSGAVAAHGARDAAPGYAVLARQLQRQRSHMPVRKLVGEMGDVLTTLTPCLMMSPLSVARFLPPDQQLFDLVVFDEASQITVPDAIGAIARGRRSIIVGDPKQMPPTSFFERGAEDEANEEAQDLESILDEALAARMPHYRLTGHYRSRHESLICFSNHAYYGGELVTYPSPSTAASAVTLRRVNGVYARGKGRTNEIEAKAVVAEVVRRLRDPELARLSLGVVTFNSEQQRLVLDLLDQARRADPDLEPFFGDGVPEPVFVKNLETVQGDQRDVILLSVGYGPTEPGARTMPMSFGPLNRKGGERRLNVAITRATTEVVVFASFDAAMIDLTRTSSEAVRDLKTYLDFAERGPVALGGAIRSESRHAYANDFEQAVAEGLRRLGWIVHTQVGVSKFSIDLGIVHPDAPGRYLAGVECDGATYHAMATARDRDRVRQIVLENLGWTILRVWSTDYFIDPDAALDRLHAGIREVLETERASRAVVADVAVGEAEIGGQAATAEAVSEAADDAPDAGPSWTEGDVVASPDSTTETAATDAPRLVAGLAPGVLGIPASGAGNATPDPQRFYDDPTYRRELAAVAVAIVDAEGPVTFQALCVRIARAHGFQRTGREIVATIRAALGRQRRMTATPDGEVCWPEAMPPSKAIAFRDIPGRDWKDVPHPEKLGLVAALAPRHLDLARAVASRIGLARVRAPFVAEVEDLARAAAALSSD
jgi:very-short-patch-repair endonuclease